MVSRLLLAAARHPLVGTVVGSVFQYADFLLPIQRRYSTSRVLAFEHPNPSWKTHILLVPKRRVRSLLAMAQPPHDELYIEILLAAQGVARRLGLEAGEYVLCANGGPRQEVQQVHFHLFSGEQYVSSPIITPAKRLFEDREVLAFNHPVPNWEVHLVVRLRPEVVSLDDERPDLRPLGRVAAQCIRNLGLDERGYTLVIDGGEGSPSRGYSFHVIAGRRC